MIKEFIEKWDKYKNELEEYFKTNKQLEYSSYELIVKALFDIIINKDEDDEFDTENIVIIDDGDYQGTRIIILHKNCYQPNVEDYVYTNTYYGSCSGCDTLLAIQSWNLEELPNQEQVKEYMILALHLLQKCKYMIEK